MAATTTAAATAADSNRVSQVNARLVGPHSLRASFAAEVLCWGEYRTDENACFYMGDGVTQGGIKVGPFTLTQFCEEIPAVTESSIEDEIVICTPSVEDDPVSRITLSDLLSNSFYNLPVLPASGVTVRTVVWGEDPSGFGRFYIQP